MVETHVSFSTYIGELDVCDTLAVQAKEFGEAEVWMNERLMRAAPAHIAKFITAFEDGSGRVGDPLWLVWQYEGDNTLYDLMQKKDWPYNLEPFLFGRDLNMAKGPRRRAITLRLLMQQVRQLLPSSVYKPNDGK